MKGAKHHGCKKGKWVRIRLRDGVHVTGKFDQSDSKGMRFQDGREYTWYQVRQFRVLDAKARLER